MEGAAAASKEVTVKVSGTMHLLLDHGAKSIVNLRETIQEVNQNFTFIHKAARSALDYAERDMFCYVYVWQLQYSLKFLLTHCRCLLMVIVEEDGGHGIVANRSLSSLLADIESYSLELVARNSTNQDDIKLSRVVPFHEMKDLMLRIVCAYLAHYDDELNHQPIGDGEMMLDFCKQVLWDLIYLGGVANSGLIEQKFRYLTDSLLPTMLNFRGEDLKEILVAIQIVTYKVACYSFLTKFCRKSAMFSKEYEMIRDRIVSDVDIGVFKVKALLLQQDTAAELGSDEFLTEYVNSVHQYLIHLLKDEAAVDLSGVVLEDQSSLLCNGLLFLKRALITHANHMRLHHSEEKKLSGIMVRYRALLGNIGSVIYLCLKNPVKGTISSVLSELIEKVGVIEQQTIETILSIVAGRLGEYLIECGPDLFIILLENLKEFMDSKSGLVIRDQKRSDGSGLLKVKDLVLQLAKCTTLQLTTDECQTEYQIELPEDEIAVDPTGQVLKDKFKVLHKELSFLKRVLFIHAQQLRLHHSVEEKLSAISLRYKALLGNIGSIIYTCLKNPVKRNISSFLSDLIEKVDAIKQENMLTILFIVVATMSDKVQTGVDTAQESQIELLEDAVVVELMGPVQKEQAKVLHDGLLFLEGVLIIHIQRLQLQVSEEKKLSDIRERYKALLGNIKSILYSSMTNPVKGRISSFLTDYLEKVDVIKQETMETILAIVVGRLADKVLTECVDSVQESQIELLEDEAVIALMGPVLSDQAKVLNDGLLFLERILISHSHPMHLQVSGEVKLSAIRVRYKALLGEIRSILYSSFTNSVKISSLINDYLEKVDVIKQETMETIIVIVVGRMADKFLSDREDSVQGSHIELLEDKVIVDPMVPMLKDEAKVLYDGLLFVGRVLISHSHSMQLQVSEEEKLSAIRVRYKALLGNIRSSLYSSFTNPVKGRISSLPIDYLEKVDVIKQETRETILVIVVGKMADKFLTESVDSVQGSQVELLEDEAVVELIGPVLKDQAKVLHDTLLFLGRVLSNHSHSIQMQVSEEEKLSAIRVRYKALLGDMRSILYSSLTNPVKGKISSLLNDYSEKLDVIKQETMVIILVIVVGRMANKFLIDRVNCFQGSQSQLLEDEVVLELMASVLKDQAKVLHDGLLFLDRVLISHSHSMQLQLFEKEKLSVIRLRYKALLEDIGYILSSSMTNPMKGMISSLLIDYLEVDVLKQETIETILVIVVGRMADKFLTESADSVQGSHIELLEDKVIVLMAPVLKDEAKVLYDGILFLGRVLISHTHSMQLQVSVEEKLSAIRVRYKALLGDIQSILYSSLTNPVKGRISSLAIGYLEKVDVIKQETMETILIIVVGRMADKFLTEHVDSVKGSQVELLEDKVVLELMAPVLKDEAKVLYDCLLFLGRVLISHSHSMQLHVSGEERLSAIRVRYKALLGSIQSFILKGGITFVLSDLIEKVEVIQEEAIETICCIMLGRMGHGYLIKSEPHLFILLLENLPVFMECKSNLTLFWKDQFDPIQEKLLLLQSIPQHMTGMKDFAGCEEEAEKLKHVFQIFRNDSYGTRPSSVELDKYLTVSQGVAFKMACHSLLRRCSKFNWWSIYSKIKDTVDSPTRFGILGAMTLSLSGSGSTTTHLTDELLVVYADCIQCNLNELLKDKSIDSTKRDQFKPVHEGFSFLMHILISSKSKHWASNHDQLSDIRIRFLAVVSNLGSLIFSCFNNQMEGNAEAQVSNYNGHSDCVEKLNLIKEETIDTIYMEMLHRIGRESPRTDQLGFLNLLLDKHWEEFMDCELDLIMPWKDQFQTIREILLLFRSFVLNNTSNTSTSDEESLSLCKRMTEAGYMVEYLLSSFAGGAFPVWFKSPLVSKFMEYVELIKEDMMEAKEREASDNASRANDKDLSRVQSQVSVPTADHVVVGFQKETELVMERLFTSTVKHPDVISIIGMPGLGKTTLAKKVYEDPDSVSYFDVRAWCCISQEYNKKEVFLSILSSLIELPDLTKKKSEADLLVMVHKQLKGRRYLIVVDDVWQIAAFLYLKRAFPDDGNGSRVVLTSRNIDIGFQAKCHSDPIKLGFLTEKESWDLLTRKIYGEERCPPKLCEVGKRIAQKCSGLPLAIVVVAGFLPKSVQKRNFWEQVAENLSSYLAGDPENKWTAALDLSYKYLPDSLKPLFLYLGAFPEDKEIPTDKLTWLWIAEGIVYKTKLSSLENQAEAYLMDLIGRSLVMVSKRRSDGRVKSCHIHDLLRDMCLANAKEDNFMHQIHDFDKLPDPIFYQRRLSISLRRRHGDAPPSSLRPLVTNDDLSGLSINPPLHTFFNMTTSLPRLKEGAKSVFSSLKLLRVLHSENTMIADDIYGDIIQLVYLRYIWVRTSQNSIPPTIANLQKLETLIIEGVRGEIVVPETVWEMVKLKHLHIDPRAKFTEAPKNSSGLEKLETLSTPSIVFGEEEKLIKKVRKLQKLRCVFTESNYSYRNIYPDFKSLDELESLKVLCYGRVKLAGQFKLPLNLKKLSISMFRLKWSQISVFHNLEILKLRWGAVQDELWDTGDDVFPNLKVLKLENLNIKSWKASEDNFPELQKLILEKCKQLKEIPSGLGDIITLERIEVLWCLPSTAKSAKDIQKEQIENGNVSIKVHIHPPDLDLRPTSSS